MSKTSKPGIMHLLRPYSGMILLLVIFALLSNSVNLILPRIIAHGIDAFSRGKFPFRTLTLQFSISAGVIFIFTSLKASCRFTHRSV
jgi:ATP-binding cassette subfamily B protein